MGHMIVDNVNRKLARSFRFSSEYYKADICSESVSQNISSAEEKRLSGSCEGPVCESLREAASTAAGVMSLASAISLSITSAVT